MIDRRDSTTIDAVSLLTDHDVYLFREGNHYRLYDKLGAHPVETAGVPGVLFAVWAPNAESLSVIGDFNGWEPGAAPMRAREDASGIWECFVPELPLGVCYKYHLKARGDGYEVDKGDPYATRWEGAPRTGSIVWDLDYEWGDAEWMRGRASRSALDAPMSVYEVHLGSWRRIPGEGNRHLTYRELAHELATYVTAVGFTHVELLPVMEHPFYGSWGYQTVGFFAPTSRYGTPQDFMYLVDHLHQHNIGVILDWVPSHFPGDEHGLSYFDGTYLYEHSDPRKGFHPEWNSYIFNYGRHEVRSFLGSSALSWLDRYHADALRVDAVASMLYLDYSRKSGEWIPNEYGGNENIEAISFVRDLNTRIFAAFPGVQTIAEESTAWPMVSRPAHLGGLGFGMKWNMGWMHDTLDYMSHDPVYRHYHHDQLMFSIWYAFSENFMLPFSHDEVVYGKRSLLGRMPGDEWGRFANLRALYGYMWSHPGKKLLFMGSEFGQHQEWSHERSLDWNLLDNEAHAGMLAWVRDLNTLYRSEPALHGNDFSPAGFRWVAAHDSANSVIAFLRFAAESDDPLLIVCNFTPLPRHNYRLGVPRKGRWKELLNSDARVYGGSGQGNLGAVEAGPIPAHGFYQSLMLTLPPLGVLFLKSDTSR